MILLSGHSLTPARKVPVESMSLTLKERESTASLTPADMEGIGISSWLRDETDPGAGIVWRVKSIRTVFATRTPTVELEHVINTLRDRLLFGEIKPGTITGNPKSTTCTAEQAVRYILRQQSDWVLGSFSYGNVANPYKFDGDSLFDALETVTNSLSNAMWTYDMSVYPFRLNIVQKPTAVESEMRAGRNIRTITRTVDKSGMYTRFYPIGANDKKIAGGYVEKNTDAYGVVSHVETDQTLGTEGELRAWANERLNLHAEPTVTIEVEGFELAAATGESLDRLTLMRICRMPLPEFNTTIQERIVALNYPDKKRQPESVKVTLTNNRQDITKILADAMKKGGRSARASSRKNAEDLAWFEDTNDHVSMCAKGIIGTDAAGNPNWVRLSEIVVDGTGIHQQVQSVQKDVVIANTKIDQNEYAIQMEANKRIDADKTMQGRLDVTATRVGMVVGTKDGKDFIKAAEICVAINDDGSSSAIIDANKVYIGNKKSTTVINGKCSLSDVTAQYISAQIATLSSLTVSGANVIGDIYLRNAGGNQQNVNGGIWDLNLKNNNNGTYTLQRKRFSDTDYVDVGTFNSAGAVTLSAPVWTTPASSSPGSNSNTVTVSTVGRPTALSKSVQLYLGRSEDWNGNVRTVYLTHTDSDPSRRVAKIDVDASALVASAKNAVKVTGPTWTTTPASGITGNSNTATFTTDAGSPSAGTPKSLKITLGRSDSWSGGTRYVYATHTDSSDGNRIARIDVTIPNPTNLSGITTYGNSPPSGAYSFGTLSKSGLTAGKYMSMTCRFGGKTFTFYFQAVA